MEHIQGKTRHARRGSVKNAFEYGVDYILSDLTDAPPLLISRNRFNLWSLWDKNHGGLRGAGRGVSWFRDTLIERGFALEGSDLLLLTQPSFLGHTFNPVSFWIALRAGKPCAFIAEVNSTFGQRHCYFCANEGFRPIEKSDVLQAEKVMHVSPFQEIAGQYRFNFDMTQTAFNIRISYENEGQGVLATLSGLRRPATSRSLLWAALRRPLGALRVVALIHWQAMILYVKRAPFLKKQPAPKTTLTHNHPHSGASK